MFRYSLLFLLNFFLILGCSYQPLSSLDDIPHDVTLTATRRTIEIKPNGGHSRTALLFYPGGLVDDFAYVEPLANFADSADVLVVIAKMPGNLAVFDINSGLEIIKDYPKIDEWVIAGHSLGGAMAGTTLSQNRSAYKGIIFMDSYPPDGNNLKDWSGAALLLFSSIEKIQDTERLTKTLSLVPPATWLTAPHDNYPAEKKNFSVLHQIDGGSHSYFGNYGPQTGDYPPTITREQFHDEVVAYMKAFFVENGWMK